jgi:hypothetical protein
MRTEPAITIVSLSRSAREYLDAGTTGKPQVRLTDVRAAVWCVALVALVRAFASDNALANCWRVEKCPTVGADTVHASKQIIAGAALVDRVVHTTSECVQRIHCLLDFSVTADWGCLKITPTWTWHVVELRNLAKVPQAVEWRELIRASVDAF